MYPTPATSRGLPDIAVCIATFLSDRRAQNLSSGTVHFYDVKLKVFMQFCNAQLYTTLADLTPDSIRSFLLQLREQGHNPGGIHCYYRTVKTLLSFIEAEYEPAAWHNPIRKVKAPRVATEPLQGIETDTFNKLLAVCEKHTFCGERDRTILLLLLETGMRASELCNLNVEDVNLTDSSLLIRCGKGKKPRFVFIGKTARKQLRIWLRYCDTVPLFVTRGQERLCYMTLRQVVRRLAERAGVKQPGLHDFRRSYCLQSLRAGVDMLSLSRLMGHSSLQMLSRYARQTKDDLQTAYKSVLDRA
jgi:integrase/recombinase XerD